MKDDKKNNKILFSAKAIPGAGRGSKLGFPTINLDVTGIDLDAGVYLAEIEISQKIHQGLLFFGKKQTFDNQLSLEVFIKDFVEGVSGRTARVKIIKKIRDVKKFANSQELQNQIKLDIKNNL